MDSKGFFKVLYEISIKTDDSDHVNLRDFLLLSPDDVKRLSVNKLAKVIKKFMIDNNPRNETKKYYMELIRSQDPNKEEIEEESGDEYDNNTINEDSEERQSVSGSKD